jgi:microcystin-dependent protein
MDPFIGEIRAFGFNYAPNGWAFCDGRQLPIAQYSALFSLLGTSFGGNGVTTFGLPNLQSQASMHWGQGPGLSPRVLGETGGESTVTLQTSQMPSHTHNVIGATGAGSVPGQLTGTPSSTVWLGNSTPVSAYSSLPAGVQLDATLANVAIGPTGGSQPHQNEQPLLAVNFCIALEGVYPSRS